MKVYIASSWKNADFIRRVANLLRDFGHEVDDFTDSSRRQTFCYTELQGENLNTITALQDRRVRRAFLEDKNRIDWCNCVLLILPCGKSAHLEAGYGKGCGKSLVIYLPTVSKDFEVMYGFADLITSSLTDVVRFLGGAPILHSVGVGELGTCES